jgi:hypothetical protein
MRRWQIVLGVLLAAGCALHAQPPLSPTGSGQGTGRLVLTQDLDRGGGVYIEGYVPFVMVTRNGQEVFSGRMGFDEILSHELSAGSYELTFTVHPCDGNCGYLDPPTETCSKAFTVEAGQTVRAHVVERPSQGCSITFLS